MLTMVVSAACGFLGALFFTHGDLLLLGSGVFGKQPPIEAMELV